MTKCLSLSLSIILYFEDDQRAESIFATDES